MIKRVMIGILFLSIAFAGIVSAEENIFFGGGMSSVQLNNNYSAGDEVTSSIFVYNTEAFPIVNASLVIELVSGCIDAVYPSQDSDCDNIIDEFVISNINIPSGKDVTVPFSYKLPNDLASGGYRFDIFLMTQRTPILGMSHILFGGSSHYFDLMGTGVFPYAKILRTKTNIDGFLGPVGASVEGGSTSNLQLFVSSNSSFLGNVRVSICEWQDNLCEPLSVVDKGISVVSGLSELNISLTNPVEPDAYAVRIELLNNGRVVSLYRSRLIVHGETDKIRKLYTDKYYYNDEKAVVSVLVGGSPDHYTWNVTGNAKLEVSLTNNADGKEYKQSKEIGELTTENFFKSESFDLNVDGEVSNFKVCAKVSSVASGAVYDEYCYDVDSLEFSSGQHSFDLKESYSKGLFEGSVCVLDKITKKPVSSELYIIATGAEGLVGQFEGTGECVDVVFEGKGDYSINVLDRTTSQNKIFEISLGSSSWMFLLIGALVIIVVGVVVYLLIRLKSKRSQNGA